MGQTGKGSFLMMCADDGDCAASNKHSNNTRMRCHTHVTRSYCTPHRCTAEHTYVPVMRCPNASTTSTKTGNKSLLRAHEVGGRVGMAWRRA